MKQKNCFICGKKHNFLRYLRLRLMRNAVRLDCRKCSRLNKKLSKKYYLRGMKGCGPWYIRLRHCLTKFITLEDLLKLYEEIREIYPDAKI